MHTEIAKQFLRSIIIRAAYAFDDLDRGNLIAVLDALTEIQSDLDQADEAVAIIIENPGRLGQQRQSSSSASSLS